MPCQCLRGDPKIGGADGVAAAFGLRVDASVTAAGFVVQRDDRDVPGDVGKPGAVILREVLFSAPNSNSPTPPGEYPAGNRRGSHACADPLLSK